jgi:hypothetical protein
MQWFYLFPAVVFDGDILFYLTDSFTLSAPKTQSVNPFTRWMFKECG